MTTFILLAALMAAVAIGLVAWPLVTGRDAEGRRSPAATGIAVVVALAIPLTAFLLYRTWSNWDWSATPASAPASGGHEMASAITMLEAKLKANPSDPNGWMLLGRSYMVTNEPAKAVEAYTKANELTENKNPEAMLGLAEALAMNDETALAGRAGELIEAALKVDPQNPKGLWYGGLVALRKQDLATARDRWAALAELGPPPDVKQVLEQRVADLDRQLGRPVKAATGMPPAMAAGAGGAAAASPGAGGVQLHLKIAPGLAGQVPAGAPLFVLAKDPTNPGPPLAVKRLSDARFPLDLTLSDADAMAAGRTISSAKQLTIVARFSKSGMPMAQSGDVYGEIALDPAKAAGKPVDLTIDRTVP